MSMRGPLVVAGLACFLIVLSTLLTVYQRQQASLLLEGNDLASRASIGLRASPAEAAGALRAARHDARLFAELRDGSRVRSVTTIGSPQPLPIHSGRQLRDSDDRVALVGAAARTTSRSGVEEYEYDGVRYEVVGRLGRGADSLVAEDALLQSARLTDLDEPARLVADGPRAAADLARALDGVSLTPDAGGVDRRTSIDFVSPVMIGFGRALTALGAVASGLLFASGRRRLDGVRVLLGDSTPRILLDGTAVVAGVGAVVIAVVWGAAEAAAAHGSPTPLVVSAAWPLGLTVITAIALRGRYLGRPRPCA